MYVKCNKKRIYFRKKRTSFVYKFDFLFVIPTLDFSIPSSFQYN